MSQVIEARRSEYLGEWQAALMPGQPVQEVMLSEPYKGPVPIEELGSFTSEPIIIMEMV